MLAVLEDFHDKIGPERVVRLVKTLHDNRNQRPKTYVSQIKKKVQENKKKKKKKNGKQDQMETARKWVCNQIHITTQLILQFLINKPNFTPNYCQLLIALRCLKYTKVSKRKSKYIKYYLMKTWEQIAVIADSLCNPCKQMCLLFPKPAEEVEEKEPMKKVDWSMEEEDCDIIGIYLFYFVLFFFVFIFNFSSCSIFLYLFDFTFRHLCCRRGRR